MRRSELMLKLSGVPVSVGAPLTVAAISKHNDILKVQSKPTKNEKVYTYLRNVSWEETDSENEHTTVNSPTLLDKKGYLNSTDSDLNRIDCTTDFGTFDYRDFEDISFTEPFINMKRKKIDDDTNHLTMNNKNHFPVEQQISKVTQKITENIEKIEFRSITPSKPHINILQDIVINNPINDEKNIKHQSEKFQSDTNFSFPENSVKLINQNVTQLDTQQFVTQQQWNMIASNNENGFITSDVNLPNVGSHYPTCSQVAEAVPKEQMALPTTQPQNIRHPIESKTLCPFCLEEVGHFSRHLFSKHSDEGEIKQILKLPLKSNERRDAIRALRKKGDFITNQKTNEIRVVRKPNTNNSEVLRNQDDINFNREEYVPCVHCLGYYKKNYLWRHAKNCKSKNPCSNSRTKIQHLSVAQTFLVSTGLLGNFLEKSRLKQEVLNIMRPDDISLAAKGDALICIYGESYLNKHKRKQMNVVVSNKMRELARLKLTIQKSTAINSLIEILKPEMYNQIVAATKIISGYNAENRSFSASSLALHLGTNLKFLCDIARKAIITKDPLFPMIDEHRSRVQEEILQLREMIKNHWCNDISSLANKVLNEVKWEKPKLLPLTEDVLLFKNFVTAQADESYANLMNDVNLLENYKLLAESTLCMILVFNRKRIGEVQFLDIDSYYRNHSAIIQQESFVALTEVEKTMCSNFKRILVFGKGSKPVPLLLTNQMQKYVEKILEIRKTKNIVPSNNRYIFANPESNKWMCASSVLRKFAKKCGAKKPELLTSTKFRKQIATILQLMSFEKSEMEQIARFMGHTEKTHLEFYRLTEDVYQTAKVAKVLLLLNAGKGSELKGKNLAEIQIEDDALDIEPNEENDDIINKNKRNHGEFDTIQQMIDTIEVNETKTNEETPGTSKTTIADDLESPTEEVEPKNLPVKNKTSNRVRWLTKEKNAVLKYFARHVKNKIAPKKQECLEFVRQSSNSFNKTDWVRIKTLVFNTYRNQD